MSSLELIFAFAALFLIAFCWALYTGRRDRRRATRAQDSGGDSTPVILSTSDGGGSGRGGGKSKDHDTDSKDGQDGGNDGGSDGGGGDGGGGGGGD